VPEPPHKALLDRENPPKNMVKGYGPQLDLLTELANYASNLIPRAFQTSPKDLRDVIVCFTLLKQVAVMLDAVDVLARAGAITAAYLPARAAFEASLYIEWMLVADGEKKATYYYVGHVRAERFWGKRAATGGPESNAFIDDMRQQLRVDLYSNRTDLNQEGLRLIANADAVLTQPKFVEANAAFEALINTQNKSRNKSGIRPPHEPEWYKVLGKPSVRSIAKELRRLADYLVYYGKASQVMHASSTKGHVEFRKGGAVAHPIRNLAGAHHLFNSVFGNALHTFHRVLAFYRNEELPRFWSRYVQEWRGAFINVPETKIEVVPTKQP
jgi:hypothetical protein